MRSIENGITLARAANSGISMFVDPYGRVLSKSRLYTREIITRNIPTFRIITFYTRFGDWFVAFCAIVTVAGILACFINRKRPGEITNPLLIEIEEQKLAAVNR
jgi:apolipoprotein N-acyltransferase